MNTHNQLLGALCQIDDQSIKLTSALRLLFF